MVKNKPVTGYNSTRTRVRWPHIKKGVVCMGGVSYSVFGQKKAPQARKIKPDFNSHGAGTCTSVFYVFTLYCKRITVEQY